MDHVELVALFYGVGDLVRVRLMAITLCARSVWELGRVAANGSVRFSGVGTGFLRYFVRTSPHVNWPRVAGTMHSRHDRGGGGGWLYSAQGSHKELRTYRQPGR